jgi:hypothetical protein
MVGVMMHGDMNMGRDEADRINAAEFYYSLQDALVEAGLDQAGDGDFEHEALVSDSRHSFLSTNGAVRKVICEGPGGIQNIACASYSSKYVIFPLDLFLPSEKLNNIQDAALFSEYDKIVSSSTLRFPGVGGASVLSMPASELKLSPGVVELHHSRYGTCVVGVVIARRRLVGFPGIRKDASVITIDPCKKLRSVPTVGVFLGLPQTDPLVPATNKMFTVTPVSLRSETNHPLVFHSANTEKGDCGSPIMCGSTVYAIHVGSVSVAGATVRNVAFRLPSTFKEDPTTISGNELVAPAELNNKSVFTADFEGIDLEAAYCLGESLLPFTDAQERDMQRFLAAPIPVGPIAVGTLNHQSRVGKILSAESSTFGPVLTDMIL